MKIILTEKQIKHLLNEHLLNEQKETKTGCIVGDCQNGKGTYKWPSGGYYTGQWKNGERDGQGTYKFPKGAVYTGQFKDDALNGQGTYKWTEGDYYTGQFKDDMLNGQGTYKNKHGVTFKGIWVNDELNGKTWQNLSDVRRDWIKTADKFTIKQPSASNQPPASNQPSATNQLDPKEQQWLGIWEKFLVKYYGFTGGDTTNKTTLLDKKVYEFIVKNKHLYNKNKNLNKLNLLIDGIFGPVHESFMPPYYTVNNTFPIYFYQKSNVIKNIQKKLGVKQTSIFLTLTENAIIKRLNFKKTQGYNATYNRKTGVTKEIYDVIMSQDTKNLNVDVKPIERNINPNNIIQPTNMNNPEIK
jgi:hypothetical protein